MTQILQAQDFRRVRLRFSLRARQGKEIPAFAGMTWGSHLRVRGKVCVSNSV